MSVSWNSTQKKLKSKYNEKMDAHLSEQLCLLAKKTWMDGWMNRWRNGCCHCCIQMHVCVNRSCSRIDANSANHCYVGHHRPQAKSLLVDSKLQGLINQIMSRVSSSKRNRRLVITSAAYSGRYSEIIRSAKQPDGYSEQNKPQTKWGLLSLATFNLNIWFVFFLLQWQKHISLT